jgi:hypothetical protein
MRSLLPLTPSHRAEEGGHLARQDAAVAVHERDVDAGLLALARLSADLARGLDDQRRPRAASADERAFCRSGPGPSAG